MPPPTLNSEEPDNLVYLGNLVLMLNHYALEQRSDGEQPIDEICFIKGNNFRVEHSLSTIERIAVNIGKDKYEQKDTPACGNENQSYRQNRTTAPRRYYLH